MTDSRLRGFGNKLEFEKHLGELDDEAPAEDPRGNSADIDAVYEEIVRLRKEVGDLARRVATIRSQAEELPVRSGGNLPWLQIIVTVATTFVLGKLVQRLSLGAPGAAAVPLIATKLGRRMVGGFSGDASITLPSLSATIVLLVPASAGCCWRLPERKI